VNPESVPSLGRALRVLGEHGERISADYTEDDLDELAADLARARTLLSEATGPRPLTSCLEHPFGAVDPEQPVPDGQPGVCLICVMRRRREDASRRMGR
jgi:hypothetical protein